MEYTPSEFIQWWTGQDSPVIGYWQNKLTRWSKDIREGTDLYYHVQEHDLELLSKIAEDEEKTMKTIRGRKKTCVRIFGLVLDIDVGEKGKGKTYYPNLDTALVAAKATNPSAIISSGGGLHVYYKLAEPFVVENIDRDATWLRRWGKSVMMDYHYDTDPVYDVSRVMRFPGSMHKNGNDVKVIYFKPQQLFAKKDLKIRSIDDMRYTDSQLSQLMNNQVPGIKDPSRVCFRLAAALLGKGWSDSQIKYVMIQWRSQHATDMKLQRTDDWYQRTIDAAKEGVMREAGSPNELLAMIVTESISIPKPVTEFFRMLFSPTSAIRRESPRVGKDYKAGSPVYVIDTGDADIVFPSRILVSFSLFRNLLLDHTGVLLPTMKSIGGRWESFVQAFVTECEKEISSSFASEEAFVAESVFEYFADAAEGEMSKVKELRSIEPPIVCTKDNIISFRSTNMLGWVNQTLGVKISAQAISGVLHSLGCVRKSGGIWSISHERIVDRS